MALDLSSTYIDLINAVNNAKVGKTSELENDSGFITKSIVPNSLNSQFAVSSSGTDLAHDITISDLVGPSKVRMRGITFGDNKFVIVGTSGACEYSTDNGETWTLVPAFTSNVITAIAYGNGYFVCIDSGGLMFKSQDAITWTSIPSPTTFGLEGIVYANGRFVVTTDAGNVFFSDNLETFINSNVGADVSLVPITYGKDRYVTASTSGEIYYSLDGLTWSACEKLDTTHYRAAAYGKGKFIIGGAGGMIKYSSDGVTWNVATATRTSTDNINYIRAITYVDGKFFAVMYTASTPYGEIWTSLDGESWTELYAPVNRMWAVIHGNDIVIATGDNGSIQRLDLNITWSDIEPEITPEEILWQKTQLRLTDGSLIESEVEVHTNLTSILNRADKVTITDLRGIV